MSFIGVAAAQAAPNPTGSWSLTDTYDNVPPDSPYRTGYDTVTFTPTSPGVYTITIATANGGGTSGVPISGDSFTFEACGASAGGAIYPEGDCPAGSGYFKETWQFDYTGSTYTATGSFQAYAADGSTDDQQYGTFTATGPASTPDFTISGTLTSHNCSDTSCAATPNPVPDVTIDVASTDGGGISTSDASDPNGDWSVDVPDGDYTVTPDASAHSWSPSSQQVKVDGADVDDVDFGACGNGDEASDLRRSDPIARAAAPTHCTTTTVVCRATYFPDPGQCLVTVRDVSSTPIVRAMPTGTVDFLATNGSSIGFPLPGHHFVHYLSTTLTLEPSPKGGAVGVAVVQMIAGPATYAVTAKYIGTPTFKPSPATPTTFLVRETPKETIGHELMFLGTTHIELGTAEVGIGSFAAGLSGGGLVDVGVPFPAPPSTVLKTPGAVGLVAGVTTMLAGGVTAGIGQVEIWAARWWGDPPDAAYRQVAVPQVPRTPDLPSGKSPIARSLRALVGNGLRFYALAHVVSTTLNRADSAGKAGDVPARTAQVRAGTKYLDRMAGLINSDIALERKVARELRNLHVGTISLAGHRKPTELPVLATRILRALGVSRGQIAQLKHKVDGEKIPASINVPNLVASAKLISSEHKLAAQLLQFAKDPAPGAFVTLPEVFP